MWHFYLSGDSASERHARLTSKVCEMRRAHPGHLKKTLGQSFALVLLLPAAWAAVRVVLSFLYLSAAAAPLVVAFERRIWQLTPMRRAQQTRCDRTPAGRTVVTNWISDTHCFAQRQLVRVIFSHCLPPLEIMPSSKIELFVAVAFKRCTNESETTPASENSTSTQALGIQTSQSRFVLPSLVAIYWWHHCSWRGRHLGRPIGFFIQPSPHASSTLGNFVNCSAARNVLFAQPASGSLDSQLGQTIEMRGVFYCSYIGLAKCRSIISNQVHNRSLLLIMHYCCTASMT